MIHGLRFLRMGLAAVVFVAALEASARLDDWIVYGAPPLGVYSDANLYENDGLGKHGKPFGGYRKWQLNEFGYRGPRVEPDRVHIACFGASETFGLYESEGHEYPRQLERELNARVGRTVYQVVNVAYPGQMIPTATLRVPQVVARLHPKLALIYATPSFYVDMPPKGSGRLVRADAVPAFEWRMQGRLENLAKSVLPEGVQTRMREWQIRRSIGSTAAMDRLPEGTIDRFREDLNELVTALRENDAQPVIVTHATIFGAAPSHPNRELLVAWRKFHPALKEEGLLDAEQRVNQAMGDVARRQHVPLIDIASEIPPGSEYFADHEHFNDAGAALMAKLLADGLEPVLHPDVTAR
jgi:hypothetical protein